jgi:predicted ATP-grasp superfamily ATP-dependent carboligase
LIAGTSTRAAAESAAKAGCVVTALDAFGDLDQHPGVRALSLTRDFGMRFTAHAAARASREIDCDAVAYLSSFENYPKAVAALAARRALWGNSPEVLRRVRDPFLVAESLRRRGFATPTARGQPTGSTEWIVKPLRSGGGQGVRHWRDNAPVPRSSYVQEWVEGAAASIVFVAARRQAVPIGVSQQLIGESALGTSAYRYCGNVLVPDGTADIDAALDAACALARAVAEEFDLVGVNGIDFIIRDGVPYPIEINPRWSSSMELVERAYGVSVFGVHIAACVDGVLPSFDLRRARAGSSASGKAIVFAREDTIVGHTNSWLADSTIRDVPRPGERIDAGQPICTIFADQADVHACRAALMHRAEAVYRAVMAWSQVGSAR